MRNRKGSRRRAAERDVGRRWEQRIGGFFHFPSADSPGSQALPARWIDCHSEKISQLGNTMMGRTVFRDCIVKRRKVVLSRSTGVTLT